MLWAWVSESLKYATPRSNNTLSLSSWSTCCNTLSSASTTLLTSHASSLPPMCPTSFDEPVDEPYDTFDVAYNYSDELYNNFDEPYDEPYDISVNMPRLCSVFARLSCDNVPGLLVCSTASSGTTMTVSCSSNGPTLKILRNQRRPTQQNTTQTSRLLSVLRICRFAVPIYHSWICRILDARKRTLHRKKP